MARRRPKLSPQGSAYEAGGRVEVHPLARAFVLEKLRSQPDADDVARAAFEFALEEGDYHQCLSPINELSLEDCLERLDHGRLRPAGEYWADQHAPPVREGGNRQRRCSIFRLADLIAAETALVRSEKSCRARSLGARSAEAFPESTCPLRGPAVSSSRARLRTSCMSFEAAFELHARASAEAVNIDDVNDAAWGRLSRGVCTRGRTKMHAAVSELESLSSVPSRRSGAS